MRGQFGTLKGLDCPIYPAVAHHLKLKETGAYYPNRYMRENYLLDFRESIKEYIKYVWKNELKAAVQSLGEHGLKLRKGEYH